MTVKSYTEFLADRNIVNKLTVIPTRPRFYKYRYASDRSNRGCFRKYFPLYLPGYDRLNVIAQ